jgi:hypothetical protein
MKIFSCVVTLFQYSFFIDLFQQKAGRDFHRLWHSRPRMGFSGLLLVRRRSAVGSLPVGHDRQVRLLHHAQRKPGRIRLHLGQKQVKDLLKPVHVHVEHLLSIC